MHRKKRFWREEGRDRPRPQTSALHHARHGFDPAVLADVVDMRTHTPRHRTQHQQKKTYSKRRTTMIRRKRLGVEIRGLLLIHLVAVLAVAWNPTQAKPQVWKLKGGRGVSRQRTWRASTRRRRRRWSSSIRTATSPSPTTRRSCFSIYIKHATQALTWRLSWP